MSNSTANENDQTKARQIKDGRIKMSKTGIGETQARQILAKASTGALRFA